ncbi:baseplate J/gp47 family protein, partial [Glaesserella parasuis]
SSGAYQDALLRIYLLTRKPATYATVPATLGGVPGSVITAPAQVKSGDGSIWATRSDVTFAPDGTATATFYAQVAGSGPSAGVNDLTIYQRQNGWQTVTNSTASVPGVDVESR